MSRNANLDTELGVVFTVIMGVMLLYFALKSCFNGCKKAHRDQQERLAEQNRAGQIDEPGLNHDMGRVDGLRQRDSMVYAAPPVYGSAVSSVNSSPDTDPSAPPPNYYEQVAYDASSAYQPGAYNPEFANLVIQQRLVASSYPQI